jgi:hypothetical protein
MSNVARRRDHMAGGMVIAVPPDRGARTMQKPPVNHGEGNPEAAAEFNKAERDFVASDKGQRKIKEGPRVKPAEEGTLEQAERLAKSRAKHDDSNTTQMKGKH